MQEGMVRKLVRVKTALLAAMFLLIMAEFSFLLFQVFDFIWAIVGAILALGIRIGFYIYQDNNGWQQKLLLALAIIGVFGPIIYYFYTNGFSSILFILYFAVCFLAPLAIMFYINRLLIKLIAQPDL